MISFNLLSQPRLNDEQNDLLRDIICKIGDNIIGNLSEAAINNLNGGMEYLDEESYNNESDINKVLSHISNHSIASEVLLIRLVEESCFTISCDIFSMKSSMYDVAQTILQEFKNKFNMSGSIRANPKDTFLSKTMIPAIVVEIGVDDLNLLHRYSTELAHIISKGLISIYK